MISAAAAAADAANQSAATSAGTQHMVLRLPGRWLKKAGGRAGLALLIGLCLPLLLMLPHARRLHLERGRPWLVVRL
jgi:hypothetical protein